MKLAIIGYGQMGKMIEKISLARAHNITATIDPVNSNAMYKSIDNTSLSNTDACIDFTHPETVLSNMKAIMKEKKDIVLGTTGWHNHLNEIKELVTEHNIGFIHAPNFSLGMNIFYHIVKESASLIDQFENYDIAGIEYHHNKKADSPSGTAKTLSEILLNNIKRKEKVTLVGFGTFYMKVKAARRGRNPRSGETIQIPKKFIATFKPGKRFKESVENS